MSEEETKEKLKRFRNLVIANTNTVIKTEEEALIILGLACMVGLLTHNPSIGE